MGEPLDGLRASEMDEIELEYHVDSEAENDKSREESRTLHDYQHDARCMMSILSYQPAAS
jgi:hypothetical protein